MRSGFVMRGPFHVAHPIASPSREKTWYHVRRNRCNQLIGVLDDTIVNG